MFIEVRDHFDAFAEMVEFVVLVRGVDVVLGETEAAEDGLHAEHLLEVRHNRDAAAAVGRDGTFAIDIHVGLLSSLVRRHIHAATVGFAAVRGNHLHLHVVGCDVLEVLLEEFRNLVGILVGDQAHGDVGGSGGWEHRFEALARVAAFDAAYAQVWTDTRALDGAVSLFAI